MKFLLEKKIKSINNDKEEELINQKIWSDMLRKYWGEFSLNKHRLNKAFVDYYEKCALHDDSLLEAKIKKINENTNIELYFRSYLDDSIYCLVYQDVGRFNFSIEHSINTYLYGEILYGDDHFTHEFTTVDNGYLYISCKLINYKIFKKSLSLY